MRIAFVNSTRRWGGVKTLILDMGQEAMRAGHAVFTYAQDRRFVEKSAALGMSARSVRFGFDFHPGVIAFFCREFKRRGISHVLVNVGRDLRSAGIAARLSGIPVFVMVGAPRDFSDSRTRRLIHALIKPRYLCSSRFIADNLARHVPFLTASDIDWVHPGVFMPEQAPRPSSRPYTLLCTSQLTPPKRHRDLVQACALLRGRGLSFVLHIVGVGDQEENLRAMVRRENLEDSVRFLGFSDSIDEELRKADIFILPTRAEPLGIALQEAMAHGLFPIARDSGGPPEIWPDRFRSWLLPPEAGPEDFADMLEKALAVPPAELDRWRAEVQRHARANFDRPSQFKKFAAVLEAYA